MAGATEEKHLKRLEDVLTGLERAGLRAQKSRCQFMKPSVTFLGHRVDAEGLHPLSEKVEAVVKAPTPRNLKELKSFLGLLSYYSKFLPNLSSVLAPLYRLLRKDARWKWSAEEEKAFQCSKEVYLPIHPSLVHRPVQPGDKATLHPSWFILIQPCP